MKAFMEGLSMLEMRRIDCQPVPERWTAFSGRTDLRWLAQPFAEEFASSIPQHPGLYCFMVGPPPPSLPQVGYPLYLGRTERTLRERFREYLREQDNRREGCTCVSFFTCSKAS